MRIAFSKTAEGAGHLKRGRWVNVELCLETFRRNGFTLFKRLLDCHRSDAACRD